MEDVYSLADWLLSDVVSLPLLHPLNAVTEVTNSAEIIAALDFTISPRSIIFADISFFFG